MPRCAQIRSTGRYVPALVLRNADVSRLLGEDVDEWLVRNVPNNNGKAGMFGISYPGFYTAGPYTALLIIEEALNAIGGMTDDAAASLRAMQDVRLSHGPIGPATRLARC